MKYFISKHRTSNNILAKGMKFYLKLKREFSDISIMKKYTARSKHELQKQLFKDYMNIALNKVMNGDLVFLSDRRRTKIFLEEKERKGVKKKGIDKLFFGDMVPEIILMDGEETNNSKKYIIFVSKVRRLKLYERYYSNMKITKYGSTISE